MKCDKDAKMQRVTGNERNWKIVTEEKDNEKKRNSKRHKIRIGVALKFLKMLVDEKFERRNYSNRASGYI